MAAILWAALALLLCAAPAWAADRPFGPIITAVSEDGFTLRLGRPPELAPPQDAELLVYPARGKAPLARVQGPAAPWHDLRATGLSPGQRYRYQVRLGGAVLHEGEVATAPRPDPPAPLLVAVFGDERGGDTWVAPMATATVQAVLSESPDLVLGTGDAVAEGGPWQAWQQLQQSHGPLWARLPYFPALGNHELLGDPDASRFRQLFPHAAGPYEVRYGPLQVLVLDSNRPDHPDQLAFLDRLLSTRPAGVRRRVVIMHHSPLSVGAHCGAGPRMEGFIQRFERHQVDAVLSGHDHTYQRLERGGVAYFVTGGGGAPLYPQNRCAPYDQAALQRFASAHHYLLLRLSPADGALTVTARAPQGPVLDEARLPLPSTGPPPPLRPQPPPLPPGPQPDRPAPPPPVPYWPFALVPVAAILAYLLIRAVRRATRR